METEALPRQLKGLDQVLGLGQGRVGLGQEPSLGPSVAFGMG